MLKICLKLRLDHFRNRICIIWKFIVLHKILRLEYLESFKNIFHTHLNSITENLALSSRYFAYTINSSSFVQFGSREKEIKSDHKLNERSEVSRLFNVCNFCKLCSLGKTRMRGLRRLLASLADWTKVEKMSVWPRDHSFKIYSYFLKM